MAKVVAAKFSQEQIYTLFKALCGGTQMVLVPSVWDKAYYERQILERQAELATAMDENQINFTNGLIDDLKEKYEAAPETIDFVSSDGTLQTLDIKHDKTDAASGTQTMLEATSDPRDADDKAMTFTVYNDVDYDNTSVYSYTDEQGNTQIISPSSGSSLVFRREGRHTNYGWGGCKLADVTALSISGGIAEDCVLSTTPQQARETVEQFMDAVGMDDMMIDRVDLYSNKAELAELDPKVIEDLENSGKSVRDDGKPETQAYVFRLLRRFNGVKVESTHDSSETSIDQVSYGKEWWYERLTIAVDDKGIANMYWTGPLEVSEVLTENTAILPWSDIESVLKKMIVIQNVDYANFYAEVRLNITRASLSLQRIMERDSFTSGLLVPVWNFYGTRTCIDAQDVAAAVFDEAYFPLISINAIDGTVINPLQGY